jgi:hypothetical protein
MLISEIVPSIGPSKSKAPSLGGDYQHGLPTSVLGINDIDSFRANGEADSTV